MSLDVFNVNDESDTSSEPPPGLPGDSEDFFVPFYEMDQTTQKVKAPLDNSNVDKNDENDNNKPKSANIHNNHDNNKIIKDNQEEKSNLPKPELNIVSTHDDEHDNKMKIRSMNQHQSNNSGNSDSVNTPIPSLDNDSNNINDKNSVNNKKQEHHHHHHHHHHHGVPKGVSSESQKQDFQRSTKWDIVYLTSSPLVFGSDPYKPLDQLDISGERDSFFNTLKASKQALRVIHKTATTSNIIAAVTGGCRCIHYSGHGYPSYLAFEDAKRIGETHLVHYDLIRKVCEDEDQRIEFVFASACHSEHVGEAFIEAGIQHVVAVNTKFEVTDEAASVFTKHFYNTLLNGRTISKSFKIATHAVAAMSSSARLDYDKFLLLPRNGIDHNIPLFNNLQDGLLIDDTPKTPINNLQPSISTFVGRAIDMRHIIHQLMDSGVRLLVLTGNSGIGKSATALMAARYFADRRMFRGGIFFIDVKKLNNKNGINSLSTMLLSVFNECGIKIPNNNNNNNNNNNDNNNPNQKMYYKNKYQSSEKEDVFNIIRNTKMGEMLLVFDGLDEYHSNNTEESIQAFLQNIFEKCTIDTKVLVTSSNKLHMFADFTNCISRYYMLRKLKPKDAAKLFARLCNQFRTTDIVSNHELMRILEYNPKQINKVAIIKHQYHCDTLGKTVKAYNTKLHLQHVEEKKLNKNKIIINHQNDIYLSTKEAKLLWNGNGFGLDADYIDIFEVLKRDFKLKFNLSQKMFTSDDLIPVFCNKRIGNMSLNDYRVSVKYFNNIYEWYIGIVSLISVLYDEWINESPLIIAGFITRDKAQSLLSSDNIPNGTFVIRFSNTSYRSIAISYKDLAFNKVEHIKGTLHNSNNGLFNWNIKNNLNNLQSATLSLASFIQKYKKINYLYDLKEHKIRDKSLIYFGNSNPIPQQQQQMNNYNGSNHSNDPYFQQQQQQQYNNNIHAQHQHQMHSHQMQQQQQQHHSQHQIQQQQSQHSQHQMNQHQQQAQYHTNHQTKLGYI